MKARFMFACFLSRVKYFGEGNTDMKRRHFAGCILLLALGVSLTPAQNRKANLSRLVVVGDSLSAGFQNFSLLGTQQIHNYASLVAGQANTPLVLPLVRFPGVPNVLQLTSLSPLIIEPVKAPNITDPVDARIDPSAIPTNLAVPGVFVADILNKRPTPTITSAVDFLTDVVLGVPAGQPRALHEAASHNDFFLGGKQRCAIFRGDRRLQRPDKPCVVFCVAGSHHAEASRR